MSNLLGSAYRFNGKMQTCISLNRYGTVAVNMAVEQGWAAAVRKLRVAKGWSQGELAEKAGIRGNTLSSALAGKTSPRLDTLEKLAAEQALNVPLWRLFVDDRQADLLQRQEAIDASVTNESETIARIKQQLLTDYAAAVDRALLNDQATGQSVSRSANPSPVRPQLAPVQKSTQRKKKRSA